MWPWSTISRLQEDLDKTSGYVRSMMDRDSAHHSHWLTVANSMWGVEPFTWQQIEYLNSMYRGGYGWRQALDYMVIAEARESRRSQYDKFEVKR